MAGKQEWWQFLSYASSLGLQMAACVVVGVFSGRLWDDWMETAPWGTVFGIVLGFLAGMWSIYRKIVNRQE
ncbi:MULTISPECIES: AtpZ/AtpI family protein [Sporomusaceae]|uniref:AtpZ/AtpI family protein n=1 Tax=Sporomusaceae TaxID=1843490 RepID=UPI00035EB49A|nr:MULTISPECIES: AtpZ/AtpI family protein [Sporomusaceae]